MEKRLCEMEAALNALAWFSAFVVAVSMASTCVAESCINYSPDNPRASHAPTWAAAIMTRHGGISGRMPVDVYDPLWQHGDCNPTSMTITWCFPGGGTDGSGQICWEAR